MAEVRPAPEARDVHLVLSGRLHARRAFPVAEREALHALASRRRLVDVCRALDDREPPEL